MKDKKFLINGTISLLIGITGLCYLKYSPCDNDSKYNPLIIQKDGIEIQDVNRDSVVDIIKSYSEFSQRHNVKNVLFIDSKLKQYIKDNNSFLDMYGFSKSLSPELQKTATSALKTNNFSELEKSIIKLNKKSF